MAVENTDTGNEIKKKLDHFPHTSSRLIRMMAVNSELLQKRRKYKHSTREA